MLLAVLTLITVALAYVFWLRPILRQTPTFKEAFDAEENFWAAIKLRFGGIKQKLTTAVVMISGFVVSVHDFTAPLAQQAGLNVQEIIPKVPGWAWPLVSMAMIGLVQFFRHLRDKREE